MLEDTDDSDDDPSLRQAMRVVRPSTDDEAEVRRQVFAAMGVTTIVPRIGRYRLGSRIGQGGAGTVFEATDEELGRAVAIKIVRSGGLDGPDDAASERRLLREARAIAALSHPNVVAVYDVGRHEGVEGLDDEAARRGVYLVMERLRGCDLAMWIRSKPSRARVLEVLHDTAAGLAAAHAAGLVHRDFKPGNAFVTDAGVGKVLDFGLARTRRTVGDDRSSDEGARDGPREGEAGDDGEVTALGSVLGTLPYMAPEQFGGEVDAAADQYAFCVTAIELLTGRRPFAGAPADMLAAKRAQAVGALHGVPRRLHAVIRRGLAADPRERNHDMHALVRAFAPPRPSWRSPTLLVGAGVAAAVAGVWWFSARPDCAELDIVASRIAALAGRETPQLGELAATAAELRRARVACPRGAGAAAASHRSCLEQRAAERLRLIDVIDARDLAPADMATALAALPAISSCAEPVTGGPEAPQPGATVTEAVAAARARLQAARALGLAGHLEAAAAEAQAAAQEASSIGWAPIELEAAVAVGVAQVGLGELAAGRASLEAAYWAAAELPHPEVMERSAEQLAVLHSRRLHDPAQADAWERHAEAALERMGQPPVAAARLATARGSIRSDRGAASEAVDEFERALVLLASVGDDYDRERASLWSNLGEVLSRDGRHDQADAALDTAAQLLAGRGADAGTAIVAVLVHRSNLRRRQNRVEEAIPLLEDALERIDRAYVRGHPWRATVLNDLGAVYGELGRFDEAGEQFAAAIAEAQRRGSEVERAGYQKNLALVHERRGDWSAAIVHYEAALEDLGPSDVRHTQAVVGLARALISTGQPERARREIEQLTPAAIERAAVQGEIERVRARFSGVAAAPGTGSPQD